MISQKFFTDQMNILIAAFPSLAKGRMSRIFQYVEELPEPALVEIVNTMLDSFGHAPLPKDFQEAALAWRKRNHYWGHQETIDVDPIQCTDCYETGYIFCRLNSNEPETLVYCHCQRGHETEFLNPKSIIPRWEKGRFDTVYGFIKNPFPVKWFIPDEGEQEPTLRNPKESSKVRQWVQKIKNAESYFLMKSNQAIESQRNGSL